MSCCAPLSPTRPITTRRLPDVRRPRRGRSDPLERGERTSGGTPDEIHTEPGDGPRAHIEDEEPTASAEQPQLHPQGAADESAACYRVHRSQRGAQVNLQSGYDRTSFGVVFFIRARPSVPAHARRQAAAMSAATAAGSTVFTTAAMTAALTGALSVSTAGQTGTRHLPFFAKGNSCGPETVP